MILRQFPNLLSCYRGLTEELAYNAEIIPLRWGVCVGYPDVLTADIEDVLDNEGMHLGVASFTKSRWTRFLRRYFRDSLQGWVHDSMRKLNKYPSRPFVCSYDVNHDTKHNYGGCLSSLQIRINPKPEVILYSRACHIDKIGFLDLALINVIAKEMGVPEVEGRWVVSLGYISGISQIYYLQRFNLKPAGHRLEKTMKRLTSVDFDKIKFGPLKRGRTRMMALAQHGEIPRSAPVSSLTIDPEVF